MIAHIIIAVLLVALAVLAMSARILKQCERAVMFYLGEVRDGARGPGLTFFPPDQPGAGHGMRRAVGELLSCTRCVGALAGANDLMQSGFRLLVERANQPSR